MWLSLCLGCMWCHVILVWSVDQIKSNQHCFCRGACWDFVRSTHSSQKQHGTKKHGAWNDSLIVLGSGARLIEHIFCIGSSGFNGKEVLRMMSPLNSGSFLDQENHLKFRKRKGYKLWWNIVSQCNSIIHLDMRLILIYWDSLQSSSSKWRLIGIPDTKHVTILVVTLIGERALQDTVYSRCFFTDLRFLNISLGQR